LGFFQPLREKSTPQISLLIKMIHAKKDQPLQASRPRGRAAKNVEDALPAKQDARYDRIDLIDRIDGQRESLCPAFRSHH